jgi:predicted DNA-binding transcriptional regulator AlpA
MKVSTPERILRKPEVRQRIPVGKTKFEEDIAPRLDKVQLGQRAVGFTESSVNALIAELIAESGTIERAPIPSDKHKRSAAK